MNILCHTFLIVIIVLHLLSVESLSVGRYGPVKLIVKEMRFVKGPRRIDCSRTTFNATEGYKNVTFTINILQEVKINKIKITFWEQRNGTFELNPDIVKSINNPCNYFFTPILLRNFRVNHNCVVAKQLYVVSLDTSKVFYDIVGNNFFYGTFRTHSVILGHNCNLFTMVSVFTLEGLRVDPQNGLLLM